MQSLHLDFHTKQDPNGRQLAAKKLATPRQLRAVQRTTGNGPSLVPVVPPGHRSLAPCAGVGTLRCGLNSASGAAI